MKAWQREGDGGPSHSRSELGAEAPESGGPPLVSGVRKFQVGNDMTVMRTVRVGSAAFVAALVLGTPVMAGSLDSLYEALEKLGATYDVERADAAAFEAALAVVDPRASVVTTNGVPSTNATALVVEEWEQGIGYFDVPSLSVAVAADLMVQAVAWDAGDIHGIILDLRGADGDSLAAVNIVARLVATSGAHLYNVKNPSGDVLEEHMVQNSVRCRAPLVVLTDSETSDGSELLAAVLRKQGGVMLVGSTTRGDAAVRRIEPLSPGVAVRIAYGKVCLGEPCNFDGIGVVPDVQVDEGLVTPEIDVSSEQGMNGRQLSEKALMDRELMKRIEGDIVLRRAADILLGLKALGDSEAMPKAETDEVRPEDK